jgi:acyl-coenzyme A synthetase/AMP-(fatty) acid ligase
MVPEICNLLPTKLATFIRDTELTQWFSVPSALTLMARYDAVDYGDFPHLKRVLWCGEVLPTTTLIHWMERLPHVEFTNLYGPTEATIASSYFTVEKCPQDSLAEIPIGRACEGEELLVLDSDLRPTPSGEHGDLYICGAGLSPGYWEDCKKTDEVFLTRRDSKGGEQRVYRTGDLAYADSDGLVYFLGRNDSQIKSRGYRIELGEIEAAMNALNVLKDCAVVGIPTGGFEGTAICCAYVPQTDIDVSPQSLRSMVSKLIPRYMLPAHWKDFPQLPKNGNGKTDRRSLVELFDSVAQT